MAAAAVEATGANVPAPDLNGPHIAAGNFMQKYEQERNKRIKAQGTSQFIDLRNSEKFKHFVEDPWIESGTLVNEAVHDGGHVKATIIGAGLGGLLFAYKLLKSGFKSDDILIVDPAGGFGGTWYWNRYPGLMCDTESYIYLPLLEETNYMPKRKYAGGEEIREHANRIASKFDLHRRSMFQTSGKTAVWDEDAKQWDVKLVQKPKGGAEKEITIHSDFVIFATGLLTNPHLPDIPGIDDFKGHTFHTSRWDYGYTNGSINNPELTGLEGKRVGLIGTGATAIQAVPHLAKYAKELIIFQRTPSAVDRRDNRDTDASSWESEIATQPGWQRLRNDNFCSFISNVQPLPQKNMVNDGWTNATAYRALVGGPNTVKMETIGQFIGELHATDYARQERIRQRTAEIVQNPQTADKLKAWYPTWCKRPTFHDDYLPAFNQPNVTLVDTDGQGIDSISSAGPVSQGKEYPVEVLVWGTGYESPSLGSPSSKCNMTVTGVDGLDMDAKNAMGLTTLHGVLSRGFPNLFFPGPYQAGASPNQSFTLENFAEHVAYIISQTSQRAGKASVQPTAEAEEAYANIIMSQALGSAAISGCTPSYLNKEGEVDRLKKPEERMAAARLGLWAQGIQSWISFLTEWRDAGKLEGLEFHEQ